MRGGELNYTTGGIGRAVALLAVPMVLEMAMQAVLGLVDAYFVGRLGEGPVAVLGGSQSMLILVFAVAMGLAMAATAIVSRRIGEGDREAASRAAAQALVLGLVVSIPFTIVGVLFPKQLLMLVNVSEPAIEDGWGNTAVLFGGNATIVLLFVANAIFRGAGDAMAAMKALWIANIINMALDPILIFGLGPIPALGVTGAGLATVIGRGVGVGYQLRVLFGGRGRIGVAPSALRPELAEIRRIGKIASPGMVQYTISSAGWLFLYAILGKFGDAVLAGYTFAVRGIIFVLLPSWGMANAAATLVGQNLGAGKPRRAEQSVWVVSLSNVVFLAAMALAVVIWAEEFIGLFSGRAEVVAYGADALRIAAYSFVFFGFGMVAIQAFNGAGDTRTPTWINLFCYWVLQIPMAWVLANPVGWGPRGVFVSITIAQSVLAVVALVAFRRGTWKEQEL